MYVCSVVEDTILVHFQLWIYPIVSERMTRKQKQNPAGVYAKASIEVLRHK